jgi:hypothetical protein
MKSKHTSAPAAPNHRRIHTYKTPAPQPTHNQHFQDFSDLLILQDLISTRINTSKNSRNPSILLMSNGFRSTRINTSENKHLKPRRINTSGHKDLKSRRINTSKKHGRGVWKSSCLVRVLLEVRKNPIAAGVGANKYQSAQGSYREENGAGDGNRTHVRSLGSFYTAIVRRPLNLLPRAGSSQSPRKQRLPSLAPRCKMSPSRPV